MGQVKSYTRKTKSGKTVKVSAHTRKGEPGKDKYRGKGVHNLGDPRLAEKKLKRRSSENIGVRDHIQKTFGDNAPKIPMWAKRNFIKAARENDGSLKNSHKASKSIYHKSSTGQEYLAK